MVLMFLIDFVLIHHILQTGAQKTLQPYGPKMCDLLCQNTKGCLDNNFDDVQMRCHLNILTSNQNSRGQEKDDSGVANTHFMLKGKDTTTFKPSDVKSSGRNVTGTPCDPHVVKSLMVACKVGDLIEVKRLLSLDSVDANCSNRHGKTALMIAAKNSKEKLFDLLMQENPDLSAVNYLNMNVLCFACRGGSTYIVRTLLDTPQHGYIFDIERRGYEGMTPLMVAVMSGNINMFDFLYKQHNANLTTLDKRGLTILHVACVKGHYEMVRYLVTLPELKGFEKKEDNYGNTPLNLAQKHHREDIVSFLKSRRNK